MVKFNYKERVRDVRPRIFVSSTFYDLRYIREDLSNFILAHDFEPIMFEDGDIGYTPGKELDVSCYEAMKTADMVVLIIGGNYGSKASMTKDKFNEYISVTRKEFKTAVAANIPMFTFVDSKVLAEYGIFDLNQSTLEKDPKSIIFKCAKDINVFYFIKEIYQLGNITVTSFEKAEDIKNFLKKQWSDMLKKYLSGLKEEKVHLQLTATMEKMDTFLKQMNLMVDNIGKYTIDESDYNHILEKQGEIELNQVAKIIAEGVSIEIDDDTQLNERNANVKALLKGIKERIESNDNSMVHNIFKYIKNTSNSSIVSIILEDSLVIKYLKDNDLGLKLCEVLETPEFYDNIFTNDIHSLEPNWDEEASMVFKGTDIDDSE